MCSKEKGAVRDFNDADRMKKSRRIKLTENPGNLSGEALAQLENAVKVAVQDGYLTCLAGWKVARDAGVSRLDVGAMSDKLGIRISECQIGCFEVAKTPHVGTATEPFSEEVAHRVAALGEKDELTCSKVFALVSELNVKPMAVASAANVRGYRLRQCQLGCF